MDLDYDIEDDFCLGC